MNRVVPMSLLIGLSIAGSSAASAKPSDVSCGHSAMHNICDHLSRLGALAVSLAATGTPATANLAKRHCVWYGSNYSLLVERVQNLVKLRHGEGDGALPSGQLTRIAPELERTARFCEAIRDPSVMLDAVTAGAVVVTGGGTQSYGASLARYREVEVAQAPVARPPRAPRPAVWDRSRAVEGASGISAQPRGTEANAPADTSDVAGVAGPAEHAVEDAPAERTSRQTWHPAEEKTLVATELVRATEVLKLKGRWDDERTRKNVLAGGLTLVAAGLGMAGVGGGLMWGWQKEQAESATSALSKEAERHGEQGRSYLQGGLITMGLGGAVMTTGIVLALVSNAYRRGKERPIPVLSASPQGAQLGLVARIP